MTETHSTIDRLEARLDHQAARIDELYRLLGEHGLVAPAPAADAEPLLDELFEVENSPLARGAHGIAEPPHRLVALHLGTAAGV